MAIPPRASLAPCEAYPLHQLIRRTAARMPQKLAVIDGERRFTYQQLDDYSDRFAAALASLGVRKGDRVGILAPNCVEFVIGFYGIIKAGAVASTINSGYREREIAHQMNDSGAETLVVHEALLPTAETARDQIKCLRRLIVVRDGARDPESFWGLIESAAASAPGLDITPEQDLAALPYCSGTTGLPKGVMLTHFNLATNLRQLLGLPGEAAMPEDGWLHTGDIVRMDPDGYVWILDRKKELIKYKGFQVAPAELEGLLLEHPAVVDAAVIGKSDPEAGEVPKAFVVRRGGTEVSAEDLIRFIAHKVATFKQVREVAFVDSIPKNPSGKVLRRVLVEQERASDGR